MRYKKGYKNLKSTVHRYDFSEALQQFCLLYDTM